ncbi:MAG: hypothetical protein AAF108_08530 [Planctomycetota bacterium]
MVTADRTANWTQHDLDLRRSRRRRMVEQLLGRADALPGLERALVEAVYRDGRSLADIARRGIVPGVTPAQTPARTLGRRFRKIVARLTDPTFQYVSWKINAGPAGRSAPAATWSPTRRSIAERVIIFGRSQRTVAGELGLSLHTVRKHTDAVRVEAMTVRSSLGRGEATAGGAA